MNNLIHTYRKKALRGFGLVESLLSITILAMVATIVAGLLIDVNRSNIGSTHTQKAHRIVTETSEALRSIRDQNFLFLENGTYGLINTNGVWSLGGTEDLIDDIYTRRITIADVYRNGSGDIDSAGTELDERIKQVSIQVEWETSVEGANMIQSELLISDWEAQETISSDTSEWQNGTFDQTTTGGSGDGALILDSTTTAWENNFTDINDVIENEFNADGNDIFAVGTSLYMAMRYQGGQNSFLVLDASDPTNVQFVSGIQFSGNTSSYEVLVQNNYAYVGTNSGSEELIIVDVSDENNLSIAATVDLPGNKQVYEMDIENDKLYITRAQGTNPELAIYDISNATSPSLLGSYEFSEDIYNIDVENDIAYLATDSTSQQLHILDVSNPASIQVLSSLEVSSGNTGRSLISLGTSLLFGTTSDFNIVDVSTPSSPSVTSTLSIGGDVTGVDSYGTNAFVTTDIAGEGFKIISIENFSSPVLEQTIDLGTGVGINVFADARAAYVTSNSNESSLYVFTTPQESYYPTGNFISQGYNSGSDSTEWLTFNWEGEIPPNTTLSFQMRFADTEANLSSATWTGPDGTNGSVYTDYENIIVVPSGASGRRWMQFRVDMTSDGEFTPEVYSVRVQFAP